MKIFSKDKMMERLKREYRTHKVDAECKRIMDMLDGKEVQLSSYKKLVFDQESYYVRHEGKNYPVNPNDCIEK